MRDVVVVAAAVVVVVDVVVATAGIRNIDADVRCPVAVVVAVAEASKPHAVVAGSDASSGSATV